MLLAGPSGAGKSTLVRALAGLLLTADVGDLTGDVRLDGQPVGHRPGAAALLLQDPTDALVAARAGRDVAFGPENIGLTRPDIWRRVTRSLAAVRFPYDEAHPTDRLSGGERQRLALAGALALEPGLLLLDEPTSMLDDDAADAVRRLVLEVVAERGATLVVVEHRIAPWLDAMDRLVVLGADGRIVADGPPSDVLGHQAEILAAQGVWVPGLAGPVPVDLPPGLAAPWTPIAPADPHLADPHLADPHLADPHLADPHLAHPHLAHSAADPPALRADEVAVAGRLPATSIALRPGELTAITGTSGAGKSTLLATLAGLVRPTSGAVIAGVDRQGPAGSDPASWSSRELSGRIGWVPQHAEESFVARSVRAELLAGRPDIDPAARALRVDGLLQALGLDQLAGADPYRLSGGEQRRVAVAAALAQGPAVLLLDEPTVGQDRLTWAAVTGALGAARAAGGAVAVATHDAFLTDALADVRVRLPSGPAPATSGSSYRRFVPASRCGPLAVLVASLLAVVGASFIHDWRVGAVTVGAQALVAPLAVDRWRVTVVRLAPPMLAALSIGWSSWLLGGHDVSTGVAAGLRIVALVAPGALLTLHLDPSRLGDDLAQRVRLPARPVVAAVAAVQRIQELSDTWRQARWSRRVRGLGAGRSLVARLREAGALTFVLLVQTIRRATRMAVAMDARGFAGARSRTWAEPSRWGWADTVLVLIAGLLAAVPIVADVTWW